MASKLGLLSFELSRIGKLEYDPEFDRQVFNGVSQHRAYIQPIVNSAHKDIMRCMCETISTSLTFSQGSLVNLNNFLHVGSILYHAEIHDYDMNPAYTCLLCVINYHRLDPASSYKITINIEEIPNSKFTVNDKDIIVKVGFTNRHLAALANLLDEKFMLKGRIEIMPIILRGYYGVPRYMSSSDNRVLEYDFDDNEILYKVKSKYQTIEVIQSKSLGKMLLLNRVPSISEFDLQQTHAFIDSGYIDYKQKECLILGGGDGSLLNVLLKQEVKSVILVEIDRQVLEASSIFFPQFKINPDVLESERYKIIIDDVEKYLSQLILDNNDNNIRDGGGDRVLDGNNHIKKTWQIIFNDMTLEPHCVDKKPNKLPQQQKELPVDVNKEASNTERSEQINDVLCKLTITQRNLTKSTITTNTNTKSHVVGSSHHNHEINNEKQQDEDAQTREPITDTDSCLSKLELRQQSSPWWFLEKYLNLAMACLDVGGLFIMRLQSVNDTYHLLTFEQFLMNSNYNVEFEVRKSYVPTRMEVCCFYTIKKLGIKNINTQHEDHIQVNHPAPEASSSKDTTTERV